MAVSLLSHRLGGLNSSVARPKRVHAGQPCKAPGSYVRVSRPTSMCARAYYGGRHGSCDQEAMKRMMQEMESMAKQWRETGKVSGGFFWPGGGYTFGGARPDKHTPSSTSKTPAAGDASTRALPLDVVSTDGFYLLYADIPGLSKADLSIKLSKERALTISGQRSRPREEGFSQQERRHGPFSRSWLLPEDADSEGISAKVAEGVLTITVPKKQPEPEEEESQIIIN